MLSPNTAHEITLVIASKRWAVNRPGQLVYTSDHFSRWLPGAHASWSTPAFWSIAWPAGAPRSLFFYRTTLAGGKGESSRRATFYRTWLTAVAQVANRQAGFLCWNWLMCTIHWLLHRVLVSAHRWNNKLRENVDANAVGTYLPIFHDGTVSLWAILCMHYRINPHPRVASQPTSSWWRGGGRKVAHLLYQKLSKLTNMVNKHSIALYKKLGVFKNNLFTLVSIEVVRCHQRSEFVTSGLRLTISDS